MISWKACLWAFGCMFFVLSCGGEATKDSTTGGGDTATGGGGNGGGTAGMGGDTGTTGMGGQAGGTGGTMSTTGTLPEGTFPCGTTECMKATQYCKESSGGPCCEPPGYECVDLPMVCQVPGADCNCFEQTDCPCGGPGPCSSGGGIFSECNGSLAEGMQFLCAYP